MLLVTTTTATAFIATAGFRNFGFPDLDQHDPEQAASMRRTNAANLRRPASPMLSIGCIVSFEVEQSTVAITKCEFSTAIFLADGRRIFPWSIHRPLAEMRDPRGAFEI
jgi:hypothetical protein